MNLLRSARRPRPGSVVRLGSVAGLVLGLVTFDASILAAGIQAASASTRISPAAPTPRRMRAPARPAAHSAAVDTTLQAPRFYLSWHEPWGTPGASPSLAPACADTLARDTLYLSFEPTRSESTFLGFAGDLMIYPPLGDSLGSYWDMAHSGRNAGGISIEIGSGDLPGPTPFAVQGIGGTTYDYQPSGGRLRFYFAVPSNRTAAVAAGTRYTLARVFVRAHRTGLEGCGMPVCFELTSAKVAFHLTGSDQQITRGGMRFAGRGAGAVCREHPAAWRPASLDAAAPHR